MDEDRNMTEKQTEDLDLIRGTLVRGIGGFYTIRDENLREYTVRCKKKFRHERITPMVGDEVLFSPGQGEEHGWLEQILPRSTECLRPPVANVTRLVIVIAPVPKPDMILVDRQISRANSQGMDVLVVVTKHDLDPELPKQIETEYRTAGIPVISVSAKDGTGLETLRKTLADRKLSCFTGQSGAGKSTLLNALLGLELETGDISRKIERGKTLGNGGGTRTV